MYKIIGKDGQTYGPVTAEQVRAWITENRANAQTLAQAEGTSEWKPLNSFLEFAAALISVPASAAAPPTLTAPASSADPRASNKLAAGICGILLGTFGVHKFILGYTGPGLIMLLVTILTCGLASPVMHIIGLIEGIMYLCKSDDEFVRLYVDGRKEWF
jgi:TM2 domain-containing membrane protein YozV